jgi:hypothetical protein
MIIITFKSALTEKEAISITGNKNLVVAVMSTETWIAVTLNIKTNKFERWHQSNQKSLIEYLTGHTVIGWNINSFEMPILAYINYHQARYWERRKSLDLREIAQEKTISQIRTSGIEYSIHEVIQTNLPKAQVPISNIQQLFKANEYVEIFRICEEQVKIQLALYQLATTTGLQFPRVSDELGVTEQWSLQIP